MKTAREAAQYLVDHSVKLATLAARFDDGSRMQAALSRGGPHAPHNVCWATVQPEEEEHDRSRIFGSKLMASRYERLFKGLAKTLGTDPKFQDLVNVKKAEIPDGLGPTELAMLYRQVSEEKDDINAKLADAQVRLAAFEQRMWSAFDEAGIDNIGFADGYRVAVEQKPSVKTEDRDKVLAWLKANGFERLLSVHAQTLSTLTLERLLEELPPPDGVSVTLYPRTSLTRKG